MAGFRPFGSAGGGGGAGGCGNNGDGFGSRLKASGLLAGPFRILVLTACQVICG